MKKYLTLIAMAVALVACSREELPEPVEEPVAATLTYTLTVEATKGTESKALSLGGVNDDTLYATWAEGEEVTVYNKTTDEQLGGSLTAQEAGSSTTLKGSLTSTKGIHNADVLKLEFRSPSYASQTGTLDYIAANCDYAVAEVDVTDASTPNVTTTSATFYNQQAIVKFTLKDIATGNPSINATRLTVTAGETTITVTPSGATDVLFVAIPGISGQAVSLSADITPCYVYTYEKASASFANSQYYEITVKMTKQYADLARVTSNFTAVDGDELRGTLASNRKISIADGATVTLRNVSINSGGSWTSGDYAGLNCLGDATIVLADGTTNSVKGFHQNYPGIQAAKRSGEGEEYTLTIQGTGTLNASSNGYAAGIGGGFNIDCGNIIINGGTVSANGGSYSAGIGNGGVNSSGSPTCGDITINGGTITAHGGSHGAGIGNGGIYTGGSPSCGNITINGGEVTATGGGSNNGAAGIGNGNSNGSCGDITITGGTVFATGANGGAGIGGGGYKGNCGIISISGGMVTATGGGNVGGAAGIGGGYMSSCSDITISGGIVTAVAGNGDYTGVGIGSGYSSKSICGNILISGGTVEATGGNHRAGIGAGYYSTCGTITIQNTVTRVTATKGADAVHSIGISSSGRGSCGTVTIGGTVYWNGSAYQNNGDTYLPTSPLVYKPGVALANSNLGYKVCSDGKAYPVDVTLPGGVTVIGVVARKSGTSGIVLYKQDNSDKYTWENRNIGNPSAVNVYVSNLSSTTSKSWTCGERSQYVYCGADGTSASWDALQTRLNNAGCEELSTASGNRVYWTNTCPNDNDGWAFTYSSWTNYNKTNTFKVRPLFAF